MTFQKGQSYGRPKRDVPVERAEGRPTRTPIHKRDRISFKGQDPNYVYRMVNDQDDRLNTFVEAGYEFVESDKKVGDEVAGEGGSIDSRVSKPVGGGTRGYLMRIKKEWYEEDQKAKANDIAESEQALKPTSNQYVPGGGKNVITDS